MFSKCSLQFRIVLTTVTIHALKTLFSKCFLQFRIVLTTVTVHALKTFFSKCFLHFQIVSNTFRMHTLEALPLVAIHHIFLIWLFGNCVLLSDHCFKQARMWWCSVTDNDSHVYDIFWEMRSLWSWLFFVKTYNMIEHKQCY